MSVLSIGQATKAFISEHLAWWERTYAVNGRPLDVDTKRGELLETAVSLSITSIEQLKAIATCMLPVTSAIAAALILDNEV